MPTRKTSRPDVRRARRRTPRLAVSVAADGVRAGVALDRIAALATFVLRAERVRDAMVSVALVTSSAIARLNRVYLGHRGSTDVIAFTLRADGTPRVGIVGDVYICPAVAAANAKRCGESQRGEVERLVIHGTLHVLGWDHGEAEAREGSRMWARQEALLRAWRRRVA